MSFCFKVNIYMEKINGCCGGQKSKNMDKWDEANARRIDLGKH